MKKKKKELVVYLEDGIVDLFPQKFVDEFIAESQKDYFEHGDDKGIKYFNDFLVICSNVVNGQFLFITFSDFGDGEH